MLIPLTSPIYKFKKLLFDKCNHIQEHFLYYDSSICSKYFPMLITKNMKNMQNNTIQSVQELHLFSFLAKVSTSLVSSIFPVHSSNGLSINFFLHLKFE